METLVPFLIQLTCGAIGGIAVGLIFRNVSMGVTGNCLAGIVGGAIGGQFMDVGSITALNNYFVDALSGIAGGSILTIAIGLLKKLMVK